MIDVIVPTHGRLDLTMSCLGALYGHTRTPFHLIVVDDSNDLTPLFFQDFQKQHDNVTFVHSDIPYTSGNQFFNIGLSHATNDYVATVMNSVRVEPDWETVAIQIMDNTPEVGIVGFKCLFPNGLIESAGISFVGYRPTDIGRDLAGHRLSLVYDCEAVQWAFALLRRKAIPVLEEDVYNGFKGWDDIDNSLVVRKAGWKIVTSGLGVGYHTPRATRGSDTDESYQKNKENAEKFYKRWDYWDMYKEDIAKDEVLVGMRLKDTYGLTKPNLGDDEKGKPEGSS